MKTALIAELNSKKQELEVVYNNLIKTAEEKKAQYDKEIQEIRDAQCELRGQYHAYEDMIEKINQFNTTEDVLNCDPDGCNNECDPDGYCDCDPDGCNNECDPDGCNNECCDITAPEAPEE